MQKFFALVLSLSGPYLTSTAGDDNLASYGQDWKGYWLQNEHAEAFVATQPRLRLLHWSLKDKDNLLRSEEDDISGIKTGYLSPGHRPDSFKVGDQSAIAVERSEQHLLLETPTEPSSRLSLRWLVQLDPFSPHLSVRHELTNHANEFRELAVWSLSAVHLIGRVEVESRNTDSPIIHLFPLAGQPLGTAAQKFDGKTYSLDLRAPIHPYILRTGLWSDGFSWTYQHPSGKLLSKVPPDEGNWSPPGINLLFYVDASLQEAFAELEHLGPLTRVNPGETISLNQTLQLSGPEKELYVQANPDQELVLNFHTKRGVHTSEKDQILSWTAPLQGVPVSLSVPSGGRTPVRQSDNILFENSPLEIPRLAPLQAVGPNAARSIELTFEAHDPSQKEPQILVEVGGSGNGYNFWIAQNSLYAGVWGKDSLDNVQAQFLQTPLPNGPIHARLEIDPEMAEARMFLNGILSASTVLPLIQPHRDRCALGGVLGSTRLPDNKIIRSGTAPFRGSILNLKFYMGIHELQVTSSESIH